MKITPGPYEVVGARICTVGNDRERKTIAITHPRTAFGMSEEQQGNATLLAGSYTMYEALIVERKWWLEEHANCNGPDAVSRAERRINAITDALAKAGGE